MVAADVTAVASDLTVFVTLLSGPGMDGNDTQQLHSMRARIDTAAIAVAATLKARDQ
jgi:hypothetical protein